MKSHHHTGLFIGLALAALSIGGCVTDPNNPTGLALIGQENCIICITDKSKKPSASRQQYPNHERLVSNPKEFYTALDVDSSYVIVKDYFRYATPGTESELYRLQDMYINEVLPGVRYSMQDSIPTTYNRKKNAIVKTDLKKYKSGTNVRVQVTNSYDADAEYMAEQMVSDLKRLLR